MPESRVMRTQLYPLSHVALRYQKVGTSSARPIWSCDEMKVCCKLILAGPCLAGAVVLCSSHR